MFHLLLVLMGSIAQDSRVMEGNHKTVKVKRETVEGIEEVIQTFNNWDYGGEINTEAQEGKWFPTNKGDMMQYSMPKKDKPVALKEAVKLCASDNSKLWGEKPQIASGFSNIKQNENYWISDTNGAMAQYTVTDHIPEMVYDDICTQVKVTSTQGYEQPKIEVVTVFDSAANSSKGCNTAEFKGLTLCLRPVKTYEYANKENYRRKQTETKAMVKKEVAARRLQEIKTELTANNYKASPEERKIPAKLQTIATNIHSIKKEDQKPFPDFTNIKHNWIEIIEQMQDLERIATKIASENKLKELEIRLDRKLEVNRGQRAETDLNWAEKWNTVTNNVENNRNKISNLDADVDNEQIREAGATEHEEEEQQDGLVNETVDGYFKRFFQKLETQKQSLQNFCKNWKLDCRVIVMSAMLMIMIGAGFTALVIYITIKTCRTEQRVNRIREYLDIKETQEDQEEDDRMWQENIEKGREVKRPNPTRNHAQMQHDKRELNETINRVMTSNDVTNDDMKALHQYTMDVQSAQQ